MKSDDCDEDLVEQFYSVLLPGDEWADWTLVNYYEKVKKHVYLKDDDRKMF